MAFSVVIVLTAFGFKRFRYFLSKFVRLLFRDFSRRRGGIIGVHSLLQTEFNCAATASWSPSQTGFGDPISWMFVVSRISGHYGFFRKRELKTSRRSPFSMMNLSCVQAEFSGQTIHVERLGGFRESAV
ncbi:hypothetical protein ACTOSX_14560 [Bacillus subtilis]